MTIETCGKKNDDGLICERFKGHNGYCKNGNHVYLPGLINQGQTTKRRALFLVVVCLALAFLYSMPLMVFALEGEGLTVAIIMVILLAVMTLIMMLCWYLSGDYPNEVRVGALGDWVFKALVRSGKRYPLIGIRIKDGTIRRLPHPAARRIADHKKLRRQLLNLKEWWALPALLAEVE